MLGVYKMQARKEWWEGEELRGTALPNNVRFFERFHGSVNTVSVMTESIDSDVDRLQISMHDLSIEGK